ncbi:MAG: hypothetical protein KDD92_16355 [Caldilineaceae bacterium]|nr:hypothetical protein [Caldilineaceae bacterium]
MPRVPARLKRRLPPQQEMNVALHFWITPGQIRTWAEQTHLFFILGLGRSGTTFLAHLLAEDRRARVYHEPVRRDFQAYNRAFVNPAAAQRYIARFRSRDIYLRGRDATVYGEVNSALRRHAFALQTCFPQATLLHLVRDGRDVVRSLAPRRTLRPDDPNTSAVQPQPYDPWYDNWPSMDRFARLCWYWQAENAFVRQAAGATIRFEELLANYDVLAASVLDPCRLHVSRAQWQQAVARPRNRTERHALAEPEAWLPEQNATFWRICGEEMAACGYVREDAA